MRRRIAATRRLHGVRTRCSACATAAGDPESGASPRPAPDSARHISPSDARAVPAGPAHRLRADPADPDADADPASGAGLRTRRTAGAHADSRSPARHDRGPRPSEVPAYGARDRSACLEQRRQPSAHPDRRTGHGRKRIARLRPSKARTHPHRHDAVLAAGTESDGSGRRVSGSVVSFYFSVRRLRPPPSARDELACHSGRTDPDDGPRATGDDGAGAAGSQLDSRCSGARLVGRSDPRGCEGARCSLGVGPGFASGKTSRARPEDERKPRLLPGDA